VEREIIKIEILSTRGEKNCKDRLAFPQRGEEIEIDSDLCGRFSIRFGLFGRQVYLSDYLDYVMIIMCKYLAYLFDF